MEDFIRPRAEQPPPFMRGELVALKGEAPSALEDTFQPGEKYRIYYIQPHSDEGGETLYLGPIEGVDERDYERFEPILIQAPQYRGMIHPISATHCRRIGNA